MMEDKDDVEKIEDSDEEMNEPPPPRARRPKRRASIQERTLAHQRIGQSVLVKQRSKNRTTKTAISVQKLRFLSCLIVKRMNGRLKETLNAKVLGRKEDTIAHAGQRKKSERNC